VYHTVAGVDHDEDVSARLVKSNEGACMIV
jgi:hypothetical protein